MSVERPSGGDADLAVVGSLLADPVRARVLLALVDGRALPASVLASEAGVAASTASYHLARLVESDLLRCTPQGRYRYYTLAGPAIANLIETTARLAPARPITSLRQGTRAHALRYARRCYDHLAGRLGVAVLDALQNQGALVDSGGGDSDTFALTATGADWLSDRDIAPPHRHAGRGCIDWTEQRPHLAGPLGSLLLERFLHMGWLIPHPAIRALHVTEQGRHAFAARLGVRLPDDPPGDGPVLDGRPGINR